MRSLFYVSRLGNKVSDSDIRNLMRQSVRNNARFAITGLLVLRKKIFLQYIEGSSRNVEGLYAKIEKDPRHQVKRLFRLRNRDERIFDNWHLLFPESMDHDKLEQLDTMIASLWNSDENATSVPFASSRLRPEESLLRLLPNCGQATPHHTLKQMTDDKQQSLDDVHARGVIGKRIIAIGASAGGIEPTKQLLSMLPEAYDASIVVIIHLSPEHDTVLDSILERETGLSVETAAEGDVLKPGTVFLIPPGKNIEINNGRFRLSSQDRNGTTGPPCPIDVFFESIAENYGAKALGIVMSGTGSDGSRGTRALHEYGGIVFAQEPSTCEFDGMPRSAMDTGTVHRVMSVEEMSAYLVRVADIDPLTLEAIEGEEQNPILAQIFEVMGEFGFDFSNYKKPFILKGLERRKTLSQVDTLADYYDVLLASDEEKRLLKNDLLICVTNFFRDPLAWESLKSTIESSLLPQVSEDKTIRVWVPGCASGEEAYTVAIILTELIEASGRALDFKIYATDVSDESLEIAAKGVYPHNSVSAISESLLTKYFTVTKSGHEINGFIRKRVITATHNIIQDAPFTKMDLVCCRNLLIYMEPELQAQTINLLHFSLNIGGILFLGASESAGVMAAEFKGVNREWNIFAKNAESRVPLHLSSPLLRRGSRIRRIRAPNNPESRHHSEHQLTYRVGFEAFCRSRGKTAIVLNGAKQVSLVISDPNSLLQVAQGAPNADIGKLLVQSLVPLITINLQQMSGKNDSVVNRNVTCVNNQGDEVVVDLELIGLGLDADERQFLLLISPSEALVDAGGSTQSLDGSQMIEMLQEKLEDNQWQLDEARRVLFDTIEELNYSNEQQQSTNEQLTAANEELQSTNEELQSVNEELYTVNFEYQSKIHELSDLTHDLNNLLESTDLGVIFLDSELCVRRYTDRATKLLRLLPSDVGKHISSVATSLDYPDLDSVIVKVISLGESHERDIAFEGTPDRLHVGIYPYRVESELSQGVIISMLDLAELNTFAVDSVNQEQVEDHENAEADGSGKRSLEFG